MLGRGARFARRSAWGMNSSPSAVAYLIKEKGIDVAIRAVGELPARHRALGRGRRP